ncbi:MAG: hypothetical protein HY290_06890 [Planctomycetia bacterium]|nr:hypothetical protein [Planctomycetia bacterium]
MSISCECPECGKRLKAADSAAGKKAKCPDCGGAVPIPVRKKPKPESADGGDFDLQNLDIDAGMAGPVEEEQVACAMCGEMVKATASRCRYCGENLEAPRRKTGKRSSSSGPGMPVPVVIAFIVECLFIGLNGLGIVGNLMQSNIPGAGGSLVRMGIEVSIAAGLWQRKSSARMSALVLDGIGIVLMLVCGGFLLAMGQQPQFKAQIPQEMGAILVVILAGQIVLYITEIVALMTGSAQEYLDQ